MPERPTVSLRVDLPNGARIGPGKIALLEAIARTGSISAAGRDLGMSYRRAWLLLDALNHAFDGAVVEASAGGARGGGAVPTELGLALVAAYRGLEADAVARAGDRLAVFLARLGPPVKRGEEDEEEEE